MMSVQGLWEVFALGAAKVWGLATINLTAGVTAALVLDWLARRPKRNLSR